MDLHSLETQYLKAKIAYYDGTPIMTDAAFDLMENELKTLGSKVIEQVGSKRKDFDFEHPNRMKSLAKFQMEDRTDGFINYCEYEFSQWLVKRKLLLSKYGLTLTAMSYGPKFDGSAINIIYRNGKLESVLTRGDGTFGKDCSDRFRKHLPATLSYTGVIAEIRCEGVMNKSTFDTKYAMDFANARNIVAGIIGADDIDIEKVADINLVPLHYLVDGKHKNIEELHSVISSQSIFCSPEISVTAPTTESYKAAVIQMIERRDKNDFPLDGIVFTLPFGVREFLGENDHDPEWAIAIKFVSEEATTTVEGIEWNVGKTGELTPVVLVKPVQLAGTTVRRASGYNAGFILKNRIQVGTIVSIQKAGDIVPEIKRVEYSPE